MKQQHRFLVILFASTLAACVSTSGIEAPAGYPTLTVSADDANTLLFTKPEMRLGDFEKIHVAPVLVAIRDGQETTAITNDEARAIGVHAETALKTQLGKYFLLVEQPAPDALGVYFRITDLKPTNAAQVAMMVPPFAVVNMLSPKGLFLGSITISGEIYEGLAHDPSVAFLATRSRPGIDAGSAFGRWTVAEKVLDTAAQRLASDLDRERSKARDALSKR